MLDSPDTCGRQPLSANKMLCIPKYSDTCLWTGPKLHVSWSKCCMCSFSLFFSFSLPLIFTCVATSMSNIFHFLITATKVYMFFLCFFFLCFFVCQFVYFFLTSRSSPLSVIHPSVDVKIQSRKKDSALTAVNSSSYGQHI